ncbi:MAG: 3-dehydroquinate synthase, partial [bacterium]|nr:3-dehydroquinate synthase [bacterium]
SFVQIPTSLLAQVDASVGGKTAINHPLGKNMIGSFYQPKQVIIDLNTLKTLPVREFRSGLAEIIKYALLVGDIFLDELEQLLASGLTVDNPKLSYVIAECCRIKAQFVEVDERERGSRALLNLGHTFAHALETYTEYTRWLHGEAVAIGLYCAALLSHKIGLINSSQVHQVEQLLINAQLPHKIPNEFDVYQLMDLMGLDKKIKNNHLHFVVIKKPGECFLDDTITKECVLETLITAKQGE